MSTVCWATNGFCVNDQSLNFRAVLLRIWKECLYSYRLQMIGIFGLMIIIAGSSAGYAQVIQWVIAAIEMQDFSVTVWGPLVVVGLVFVKSVSHYAQQVATFHIVTRVQLALQKRLFSQLIDMDLAELSSEPPAAQAVRFSNCLLYTSPSPRDGATSRMPSSA